MPSSFVARKRSALHSPAMNVREAYGRKLRLFRKERRLSQEELAELAGCSTRAISNLERGLSGPGFDMLEKLASALDVPMRAFFEFADAQDKRSDMLASLLQTANGLSDDDLAVALQQVRALQGRSVSGQQETAKKDRPDTGG